MQKIEKQFLFRFLLCPDRTKCCQRSIAKAEEQKQQKSQFDIFLKKKMKSRKHIALCFMDVEQKRA